MATFSKNKTLNSDTSLSLSSPPPRPCNEQRLKGRGRWGPSQTQIQGPGELSPTMWERTHYCRISGFPREVIYIFKIYPVLNDGN